MKIHELQYKDEGHKELFENLIADKNREWDNKKIDAAHYHSQLSLCYSILYKPEECKLHAGLVPQTAHEQEKTNALHSVARILVYEKKIPEALEYLEQAYALDPEHETVIEEAGWCCFELKQYEAAQAWFTKGTLLENDDEVFWEGLGYSFSQQQKFREALAAFKHALNLCNKAYNGHVYLHLMGQCYAGLDDLYRALDCYTKCLESKPTYADALNDMAAVYFNQDGDISNAIYYLKRAEPLAEEQGDKYAMQRIYMNLASLYGKQKEFDLQEHYKAKFLEVTGLSFLFGDFDDDSDDDGEDSDA